MQAAEDYYAILLVSPEAEDAAIRAAYRTLMRRYHPDVNASVDAAAKAKAINEAYACLRNRSNRAAYDWQREPAPGIRQSSHPRAPRPLQRAVWTGPTAQAVRSKRNFQPTWWKAAGLGVAMVITSITFTITSATPPAGPPVARPALEVSMRLAPKGPTSNDDAHARPPAAKGSRDLVQRGLAKR